MMLAQQQTAESLAALFQAATLNASAAMRGWTAGKIALRLDDVREVALEEATRELCIADELLTMVVLTLAGELGGQIILTFDDVSGRQLAALLLGREANVADPWCDLEMSALNETGNILACAYMRTISELIGRQLVPSPPQLVQDFGSALLEQALMAQAMVCDRVLVCKTVFERDRQPLDWHVYFVPEPSLLEMIRAALPTAAA